MLILKIIPTNFIFLYEDDEDSNNTNNPYIIQINLDVWKIGNSFAYCISFVHI